MLDNYALAITPWKYSTISHNTYYFLFKWNIEIVTITSIVSPATSIRMTIGEFTLNGGIIAINISQALNIQIVEYDVLIARPWSRLVDICQLKVNHFVNYWSRY